MIAGALYGIGGHLLCELALADWARLGDYVCHHGWRPRTDGRLRVKDEWVRVLNEGARRGRGESVSE